MVYWNLITLSCLWATVSGHVIIGGSMRDLPDPRDTVKVHETDLNRDQSHLSLTTQANFELQLKWLNWNLCTNAFQNASFTPMNSLVPNNTIFLAPYPTYFFLDDSPATCQSKTPTRMGTIPTGEQTIFAPLTYYLLFDFADDWKNGTCGITFENETSQYRLDTSAYYDDVLLNDTLREELYFKIDGAMHSPVYPLR